MKTFPILSFKLVLCRDGSASSTYSSWAIWSRSTEAARRQLQTRGIANKRSSCKNDMRVRICSSQTRYTLVATYSLHGIYQCQSMFLSACAAKSTCRSIVSTCLALIGVQRSFASVFAAQLVFQISSTQQSASMNSVSFASWTAHVCFARLRRLLFNTIRHFMQSR